jgi:NAD(P) transhydrogenase
VIPLRFDLVCVGSGPAGQKAAIQAAKAGYHAAVIEREPQVGGACLMSGTIPSKALREQALRYRRMQGCASSLAVKLEGDAPLLALLQGVDAVIGAQDRFLQAQLARNHVDLIRGQASLRDGRHLDVERLDGTRCVVEAGAVLLAPGSRPRHVPSVEVDHEHILDSDSILSLPYLPRTMIVLGSGVIACEYASIFAALGCTVTLIDKAPEPLGFLDPALRAGFLASFRGMGGIYRGRVEVAQARFDGFSQVEVLLGGGERLSADIVLAAFGRIANVEGLKLERVGLTLSPRGHIPVDARYATSVPGIYAAGDAIGPPALACAATDQGRRAALAAFGLPPPTATSLVPTGVYTIPEIGCVGMTRAEAEAQGLEVIVGSANFAEVARAHIAGEPHGFLSLVCERGTLKLLGVQVLGEGAAELVHLGQAVLAVGGSCEWFIEQIANFPTMTEAYRIAAFEVLKRRALAPDAEARAADAA